MPIEIIKRNGRVLSKIINDILDLSKVEVGKLEVEKTEIFKVFYRVGKRMQLTRSPLKYSEWEVIRGGSTCVKI